VTSGSRLAAATDSAVLAFDPSSRSTARSKGETPAPDDALFNSGAKAGSSSRMSAAVSASFAPCRIRRWAPRLIGLSTLPGSANTSRPCSIAQSAVMRAPLFSPASITRIPSDSPLMIRLRRGKFSGAGADRSGNSLRSAPRSAMRRARNRFSGG